MPCNHNSMLCSCGGAFKPDGQVFSPQTSFEPYFDETLKTRVSSWNQAERLGKKKGLRLTNDRRSWINKCKKTLENREDIIHSVYKKDGFDYPRGKKVHFDEQKRCFVDQVTKQPVTKSIVPKKKSLRASDGILRKAASLSVLFLLSVAPLYAARPIEGVPYVVLNVNGNEYDVPIHEPDFTKDDAVLIINMLNGDDASRQVFLGGDEKKELFIGDGETIRWLIVTKDNQYVEEIS